MRIHKSHPLIGWFLFILFIAAALFYTTNRMWAKYKRTPQRSSGFTIVELLIVIVVIAILAAIVIVAYNGMQARANFSKYQTDMKTIVKALAMYKEVNGNYPISISQPGCEYDWCGWEQAEGDAFIAGLAPQFISKIPQMPSSHARADTYLYRSNASRSEYQLIRYKAQALGGLPSVETQNNPLYTHSPGDEYYGLAWGYRSNPSTPWW